MAEDTPCERCGDTEGVALEDSRTVYVKREPTVWDWITGHQPEDPNRPIALCRACAKRHNDFWDEMWEAVRADRI